MENSGAIAEVVLNDRPEVLKQMRRLKLIVKDGQGREYHETTYNGKPLRFYVGYAMTLPVEWAKALVGYGGNGGYGDGRVIPIQENCPQCTDRKTGNPLGYTNTGVCFHCRGKKWLDTGELFHIFKMINEKDLISFDQPELPQRKIGESVDVKDAQAALA